MELKDANILFLTKTMRLGGTENIIIQMCEVLKPYVNNIFVCSSTGINVSKLEQMGIKHYEIPDINSRSFKDVLTIIRVVTQVIKRENITIVHTHHRMATLYMFLLNKLFKLKLVSTLHGVFTDKKIITSAIYRNIKVVACGEIVKKEFVEKYGINEKNITVIKNAIKKDESSIIEIPILKSIPQNIKKVGYIGRLSEEKGINILFEAILSVTKKVNNVVFIIAGSGDLECEIKEKVRLYHMEKTIYFLGYRSDPQNVIKQIDITILPSYTEGLPLTPIESFAQGKPVLATKAGGTIEIVKDGFNGLLCDIGDYRTLANNITRIFSDTNLYQELAKNALTTYENEYSFEIFQKRIISFYKEVIE